jgi:monoamine oxidase
LGEFLRARAGEGAKELIGSCTGLDSFFDRAITMFLREEIEMKRFPAPRDGEQERLSEIVGGMDLLPKRLGKTIHDCIELNAEVIGIRSQNDGKVAVTISRGDQETVTKTCDVVLCTLPFSILWKIDISPPFSPEKMYAIRNLSYASSTKVLLHCSTRFWETNGGIYGGASQSDQLIRATYYPSDNAIYSGPPGLLQQYGTLYSGFAPNKYTARDSAVSKNPGVLLGSYAWGQDARRLGAMAPTERARTVIRMVSRFHPEIARPGIVDGHASMFWDAYKWSAGAFSFLQPGEHGTIYQSAIRPEGNVHFAGEHCSLQQAWIQGALVSALRAVEEIVAKP